MSAISAWQSIRDGFDFTPLLNILMSVIPALICITLHELSHGLVAYRLGDPTAKNAGRLTLNPIKHLDPIGLLLLVTVHFGYAKPVPVNMYRFKDPKRGMALTALAGPGSNVVIAVVFLFLYGFFSPLLNRSAVGRYVLDLLRLTGVISIGYAIFNMLPIPPLDGSKVLLSVLSDESYMKLMRYERYGSMILLVLAWSGLLGRPLSFAINTVAGWLAPVAAAGFRLGQNLFIGQNLLIR